MITMSLRTKALLVACGAIAMAMVAQGLRINLQAVHPNGTMYDDPAWKGVKRSWCKPEIPNKEQRMCEKVQKSVPLAQQVARCNNCKQYCHVWGDPHLAPFISDCTT